MGNDEFSSPAVTEQWLVMRHSVAHHIDGLQ